MTCELDTIIRGAVSAITNIRLDRVTWLQGSLPVRWGGIGVRSANDLAPSAFLSSLISVSDWMLRLLPAWAQQPSEPSHDSALARWHALGGINPPVGAERCSQRSWDDGICGQRAEGLLARADPKNLPPYASGKFVYGKNSRREKRKKRLLWDDAGPFSLLGLSLTRFWFLAARPTMRQLQESTPGDQTSCVWQWVFVLERLWSDLIAVSMGRRSGEDGHHGLACRRSAGRHCRHALANDVICPSDTFPSGIHAELSAIHVSFVETAGRKPDVDGAMESELRGKYLVWDFTCSSSLAPRISTILQ